MPRYFRFAIACFATMVSRDVLAQAPLNLGLRAVDSVSVRTDVSGTPVDAAWFSAALRDVLKRHEVVIQDRTVPLGHCAALVALVTSSSVTGANHAIVGTMFAVFLRAEMPAAVGRQVTTVYSWISPIHMGVVPTGASLQAVLDSAVRSVGAEFARDLQMSHRFVIRKPPS